MKLVNFILLLFFLNSIYSQPVMRATPNYEIVIDSTLSDRIPDEFMSLRYTLLANSRLHNNRIDVMFDNEIDTVLSSLPISVHNKSSRNMVIFKSPLFSDDFRYYASSRVSSSFTLYPNSDGIYIIILMLPNSSNMFDGMVIKAIVNDGHVSLYKALQPD